MNLMLVQVLRRYSRFSTNSSNLIRYVSSDVGEAVQSESIDNKNERKKPRKFIKVMQNRPIVMKQRELNRKLDEKAISMKLSWRFVGAT